MMIDFRTIWKAAIAGVIMITVLLFIVASAKSEPEKACATWDSATSAISEQLVIRGKSLKGLLLTPEQTMQNGWAGILPEGSQVGFLVIPEHPESTYVLFMDPAGCIVHNAKVTTDSVLRSFDRDFDEAPSFIPMGGLGV